jgi:hypothetical protein
MFEEAISRLVGAGLVEAPRPESLLLSENGQLVWKAIHRRPAKTAAKGLEDALAQVLPRDPTAAWHIAEQDWTEARARVNAERLARLDGRRHIIEGILAGIDHWDDVSAAVSDAQDRPAALAALRNLPLGLTEVQAQHLLDVQLGRRTITARAALAEELNRLDRACDELAPPPTLGYL